MEPPVKIELMTPGFKNYFQKYVSLNRVVH